ncbi:hypothetical protein NBH08_24225, partial [Faecalicatena sp. BF-R-105]|nr:hypothetical protein [Faecalicatena sp. BF-R-105]
MDYKIDDKNLDVSMFISFVNQVWQGNYDVEQTRMALSKTLNMEEVLIDDNMVFDIDNLKGFLNDTSSFGFIAKENNKIIGFA